MPTINTTDRTIPASGVVSDAAEKSVACPSGVLNVANEKHRDLFIVAGDHGDCQFDQRQLC